MAQSWETTVTRHGSVSGWSLHKTLGERPCTPCYNAKKEYDANRKLSTDVQVTSRLRARAQQRAYGRLARKYPNLYHQLYAEAKKELGVT